MPATKKNPTPRSPPASGRGGKLKVFRTPIGFHDAYVAAPSMKAALEAWGSGTNLFAAGAAEVVTDPELMREPLERPGEVIRKARGTDAEHVKALGASGKKDRPSPDPSRVREGRTKARPSSAAMEKAEAAVEAAEERHRAALDGLRAEEQAIEQRRRKLEQERRAEREELDRALDEARERYREALGEWAG